ncbi:MAG: NAD-dependent epimerase/dehydratase family protein [Tagaea sp.]
MTQPLPNLAGKRVALVGGAGFIGHNMALELVARGAEVHVLDSLQVNNLGAFSAAAKTNPNARLYMAFIDERLDRLRKAGVALHIVDARDYHLLSPQLNSVEADVVVQLAAIAHANRANKDPYSTFDHSMRTLENSLDAVRERKPHFIFFSSSMVYGNFDGEAVTEDRHCEPMGIYGALKYAGEKLVVAYNQVFGLPYTIVRPSALYGERCVSRRVGQALIENAISRGQVTINGDGTDRLDFTYIGDLVQGVVRAIGNDKAHNQIFNLTYGQGRSLNEMVEILRAHFPKVEVVHHPRDALMPERGTLSIEKARRLLGYEPAMPLEKGYAQYIAWYKALAAEKPQLFV